MSELLFGSFGMRARLIRPLAITFRPCLNLAFGHYFRVSQKSRTLSKSRPLAQRRFSHNFEANQVNLKIYYSAAKFEDNHKSRNPSIREGKEKKKDKKNNKKNQHIVL